MPFISKRKASASPAAPAGVVLSSGRRLSSQNDLATFVETLDVVVRSYMAPPYRGMPLVTDVGYTWQGDDPPSRVVGIYAEDGYLLTVPLWRLPKGGTEIGVFPLGSGDERLQQLLEIGYWKQRDRSLQSVGTFSGGRLTLLAPPLPQDYFVNFIAALGYPPTVHNIALLMDHARQQFSLKAYQFIGQQDPRGAERFIERHRASLPQQVLDDLVAAHPQFTPYIQELPYRIWGLLAEVSEAGPSGTILENFEK